ncbi:potassium channel AKT1-like protein, partial [Tanacetum coccineum]
MLAHLCLKFRTDSEQLQQKESLDSLPIAIRSSISPFSFFSLLDKAYLFHGVPNDLLFQLTLAILQNEAPTDFYVLVTGTVVLVVTRNGVEHAIVGDGTVIMNNLLQELMETENMQAQGRLDLPLSLCFATLRGDDLLLHKLLKRDLDANESDNNRRTALHIAASKGNTNCVLLLLDFGADPNSRGDERTRIYMKMINFVEPVATVLLAKYGIDEMCTDSTGQDPWGYLHQVTLEVVIPIQPSAVVV